MVKDINPVGSSNPNSFIHVHGSGMFFVAETQQNGRELWKTDGTENGTVQVKDIFLAQFLAILLIYGKITDLFILMQLTVMVQNFGRAMERGTELSNY